MLFSQIAGMVETKERLINAVKNNHVAHAQLFAGSDGGPNLALALAFATYINCEDKKESDSCGLCYSCIKYNKLIHPDLHFIFPVSTTKSVTKDPLSINFLKDWRNFVIAHPYADVNTWGSFIGAENKQLSISVEEARNIIKTISLKSFEAEYKVLILWLPEMMNPSGSNAILKILEEPPVKTIFLLVTNHSEKIITTIISRTQRVSIRAFRDQEIMNELITNFKVEEKKAFRLAYLANGNMMEGLRILEEAEDNSHELFRNWMRSCYKKNNLPDLISFLDDIQKLGREGQKSLLLYGLNIMRECLVFKYSRELSRTEKEEYAFVEKFSQAITENKASEISKNLNDSYYHIERNGSAKIIFLDTSLKISKILKSQDGL
jgi:DNA polymerase-3 subunit delta'